MCTFLSAKIINRPRLKSAYVMILMWGYWLKSVYAMILKSAYAWIFAYVMILKSAYAMIFWRGVVDDDKLKATNAEYDDL